MPYFGVRMPYFLILTDFYAIRTPIAWHILGAYFLQIWGVGGGQNYFSFPETPQKRDTRLKKEIGMNFGDKFLPLLLIRLEAMCSTSVGCCFAPPSCRSESLAFLSCMNSLKLTKIG